MPVSKRMSKVLLNAKRRQIGAVIGALKTYERVGSTAPETDEQQKGAA